MSQLENVILYRQYVAFTVNTKQPNPDCIYAGADMVFVIDSSGSIGSANFEKVRQFVKDVINAFDIGLDKTRVGVVQYSSSNLITRVFDLNTYNNKADMLDAVTRMPYYAGSTRTDLALDTMTNVSFTAVNGARPINEVLHKSFMCLFRLFVCLLFSTSWAISAKKR